MTTIDYFVASYGRYAASASGGNALARDVLSGILTLFATSFYEDIGTPQIDCCTHTTDISHTSQTANTGINGRAQSWQRSVYWLPFRACYLFVVTIVRLTLLYSAYIFYRHGQKIRERSAFASGLAKSEEKDSIEDDDE